MSISGNPITALLAQDKLTGENFTKWKSNKNLLLVSENHKYVLNEECPDEPSDNARSMFGTNMMPRFNQITKLNVTCS